MSVGVIRKKKPKRFSLVLSMGLLAGKVVRDLFSGVQVGETLDDMMSCMHSDSEKWVQTRWDEWDLDVVSRSVGQDRSWVERVFTGEVDCNPDTPLDAPVAFPEETGSSRAETSVTSASETLRALREVVRGSFRGRRALVALDMFCYLAGGDSKSRFSKVETEEQEPGQENASDLVVETPLTWGELVRQRVLGHMSRALQAGFHVLLSFDKHGLGHNAAKTQTQIKRTQRDRPKTDEEVERILNEFQHIGENEPVPLVWSEFWSHNRTMRDRVVCFTLEMAIALFAEHVHTVPSESFRVVWIDALLDGRPAVVCITEPLPAAHAMLHLLVPGHVQAPGDALEPDLARVVACARDNGLGVWVVPSLNNEHYEADTSIHAVLEALFPLYRSVGIVSVDTDQCVLAPLLHMKQCLHDQRAADRPVSCFLHLFRSRTVLDCRSLAREWGLFGASNGSSELSAVDWTFLFLVLVCGTDFVDKCVQGVSPATILYIYRGLLSEFPKLDDSKLDAVSRELQRCIPFVSHDETKRRFVLDDVRALRFMQLAINVAMPPKIPLDLNNPLLFFDPTETRKVSRVTIPARNTLLWSFRRALYNLTYWFYTSPRWIPTCVPHPLSTDPNGRSLCGWTVDAGSSTPVSSHLEPIDPSDAFFFPLQTESYS